MSNASMPIFSFILLTVSEKKNFEYFFFENLPFMSPRQPIKLSYLDKSRMQHGGLINKHICEKKKIKYLQWDSRNCQFPVFPL